MDRFAAVFRAGNPSLGLEPRPGTLDAAAARKAVIGNLEPSAGTPAPDRLRLLEGIALLWHDHWNEAHETAQSREGERDFDLLHAILHRREGDFANSGHWFREAGKHPCYPILERRLALIPGAGAAAGLTAEGRWSPSAFLGKVKGLSGASGEAVRMAEAIQAEEFRAFAEWLAY